MKKRFISGKLGIFLAVAVMLSGSLLSGCGNKNANGTTNPTEQTQQTGTNSDEIAQSELGSLDKVELGSLDTYKDLRTAWDDILGITGTVGAKSGMLYTCWEGETQDGSLAQAFTMRDFGRFVYDQDNYKKLADAARNCFTDAKDFTDAQVFAAGLNAYFGLLPLKDETRSYADKYISRAQYEFIFAGIVNEERSLSDKDTFENGIMSRGELVDRLVRRMFNELQIEEKYSDSVTFADVINGGDLAKKHDLANEEEAVAYALEHPDEGCPEKMYQSLVVARTMGLVEDETQWTQKVTLAEAINLYYDFVKHQYAGDSQCSASAEQRLRIYG